MYLIKINFIFIFILTLTYLQADEKDHYNFANDVSEVLAKINQDEDLLREKLRNRKRIKNAESSHTAFANLGAKVHATLKGDNIIYSIGVLPTLNNMKGSRVSSISVSAYTFTDDKLPSSPQVPYNFKTLNIPFKKSYGMQLVSAYSVKEFKIALTIETKAGVILPITGYVQTSYDPELRWDHFEKLGDVYMHITKKPSVAASHYFRACQLNPTETRTLGKLAKCLNDMGYFERALRIHKLTIKEEPNKYEFRKNMSITYENLSQQQLNFSYILNPAGQFSQSMKKKMVRSEQNDRETNALAASRRRNKKLQDEVHFYEKYAKDNNDE